MSYEKDYITARKAYLDKILALKPTGVLKTFVEEERCKMLAKTLDDSNGNLSKMKPAHVAYNDYYVKYVGKIETQIAKETVDKSKLKTPLAVYSTTLKSISTRYLADYGKLFTEEQRKAKAAPGATSAVTAGANAAAAVAAAKNLKRALEDFKAKRTVHLDAITALSNETDQAVKDVKGWHATARDSITTALNFAKLGQFVDARRVADAALNAARLATTVSAKLQNDYETKITQRFQKDRNLGFLTYESDSSFGLLKSQEGAFKTGQTAAKAIFDKAVDTGTKTLVNIKSILLLAKQAEEAAAAADDAANIKDVRPAIRSSLQLAQVEMQKLADKVTEAIETSRTNESGLFQSGERILVDFTVPTKKVVAIQQSKVKAQGIEESIQKLGGVVQQIEQLAKSQVAKVPPQLKTEEEFKSALMKLGGQAGVVKRAYNAFMNDGNTLAKKLKALS